MGSSATAGHMPEQELWFPQTATCHHIQVRRVHESMRTKTFALDQLGRQKTGAVANWNLTLSREIIQATITGKRVGSGENHLSFPDQISPSSGNHTDSRPWQTRFVKFKLCGQEALERGSWSGLEILTIGRIRGRYPFELISVWVARVKS